jgi:anthranilate phosphoribosyltransferase
MTPNNPQTNPNLNEIITQLSHGENLTNLQTQSVAQTLFTQLTQNKHPTDILPLMVAFFGGLTIKKPTVDELSGMVKAMDATRTSTFQFNTDKPLVTAGGTGGDTFPTINITTPALIIAAAAGAYAIKSGSKSFSSKTGCIDLAQNLGINVYTTPQIVEQCIHTIQTSVWASAGIYPWMKPLIDLTADKATHTVMPMLYAMRLMIAAGLNPFGLKRQVRGVSQPYTETIASVLSKNGYERTLVVLGYGADETIRIDEFSNLGRNIISEVKPNGSIDTYSFYPEDIGLKRGNPKEIAYPGSPELNTQTILKILLGKDQSTRQDLILLNAASILYIAESASDLKDGYELAKQALDAGLAIEKLNQLVTLSGGNTKHFQSILKQNQDNTILAEV